MESHVVAALLTEYNESYFPHTWKATDPRKV